jgi:hypothetical protein
MEFWVLVAQKWTNAVFCPWVEQWSALVLFLRRLVLVLIPTFRCADFSRELWRDCMVQHRWRCISADIARGCWSLGFFLFTLVCTVLALWRLHCERAQWQVYLKVIRSIYHHWLSPSHVFYFEMSHCCYEVCRLGSNGVSSPLASLSRMHVPEMIDQSHR